MCSSDLGHKIRGLLQQKSGAHSLAVDSFKKVISLCKNDGAAYAGLGVSLLFLKRYEEAIQMLKKSITYSRHNDIWYQVLNMALMYEEMGRNEDALDTLSWPLDLADRHPFIIPNQIKVKFEEKIFELDKP